MIVRLDTNVEFQVLTEVRHLAPLANAGYNPQPITPVVFIERYRGVHVL